VVGGCCPGRARQGRRGGQHRLIRTSGADCRGSTRSSRRAIDSMLAQAYSGAGDGARRDTPARLMAPTGSRRRSVTGGRGTRLGRRRRQGPRGRSAQRRPVQREIAPLARGGFELWSGQPASVRRSGADASTAVPSSSAPSEADKGE
jgi:hypothetical protein